MSEQREFMKRTDLLVILVLAGIFLGGWLWMRSHGSDTDAENYAVMSINDQIVEVWPLAEHHNDLTIDLSSYGSRARRNSMTEQYGSLMWTVRTRYVNPWGMSRMRWKQ